MFVCICRHRSFNSLEACDGCMMIDSGLVGHLDHVGFGQLVLIYIVVKYMKCAWAVCTKCC